MSKPQDYEQNARRAMQLMATVDRLILQCELAIGSKARKNHSPSPARAWSLVQELVKLRDHTVMGAWFSETLNKVPRVKALYDVCDALYTCLVEAEVDVEDAKARHTEAKHSSSQIYKGGTVDWEASRAEKDKRVALLEAEWNQLKGAMWNARSTFNSPHDEQGNKL